MSFAMQQDVELDPKLRKQRNRGSEEFKYPTGL